MSTHGEPKPAADKAADDKAGDGGDKLLSRVGIWGVIALLLIVAARITISVMTAEKKPNDNSSAGQQKAGGGDDKAGQGKDPAGTGSQPESRSSFVCAAQVPAENQALRLSLGGQREVRFILPLGDWSPEIALPPGAFWNLDLEPHTGFRAKVTDDLGAGREVSVAAHKPLVSLGLTRVKFQGVAPGQVMVVSISEAPPKAR